MGDRVFPKGRVALGSGDLFSVTNIKATHTNNAKQVHTILENGVGMTKGVEESTITFDAVISEDGQERDWYTLVKTMKITRCRVKIPNETMTVEGAFKTRDFELPLDDSIKGSFEFIGHMV